MPLRSVGASATSSSISRNYVCTNCRLTLLQQQRRTISETYKRKLQEAEEQWWRWAAEIRSGKRKSMLQILESRGLIKDVAGDKNKLDWLLTERRVGVYCGVDPTAPGLHIGHLVPLMALFWMHIHGYHTVSVVGGSTARIGDPTGRTKNRPQMTSTERKANMVTVHYQFKKLWQNLEPVAKKHGYKKSKYWRREIANNATWWNSVPFLDVLKYMGQGMRLGPMLTRETVEKKMTSGDGMSFAEFCYPIMQAWDWWRLYDEKRVQLQIGGSDQYGNIVAGLDAVKQVAATHPNPDTRVDSGLDDINAPAAFTVPLLTAASGEKFGKSAGNAVWLDQSMTSLFDLYAYWVKTADADVERYLKFFTFLPLEDISTIMAQHTEDNRSQRKPQHTLAYEIIELIHGKANADQARKQYLERAEQRKNTSLSMLMSSAVDTDSTSEYDWKPQAPQQLLEDEIAASSLNNNPLKHNQNPQTRERGGWVSRKLNEFAPIPSPNKSGSGPARITLPASLIKDQPIARVLHSAGMVTSRSEGHHLAQHKGAYIGRRASGKEQMSDDLTFVPTSVGDIGDAWRSVIRDDESGAMEKDGEKGLLVLRSGKWKVRVVRVVSDEVFESLQLPDPPGWTEYKSMVAAQGSGKTFPELARTQTKDVSFVEPDKGIRRRDAEKHRRQQRREAKAYFQGEAVRRPFTDCKPRSTSYGTGGAQQCQANSSHDIAERPAASHGPIKPAATPLRTIVGKRTVEQGNMSVSREARVKRLKKKMLREAHLEGSRKVLETTKAERRSQREVETQRITKMRESQEGSDQEDAPAALRGQALPGALTAPPVLTVEASAARQQSQRREEIKRKEMEAAKERRRRARERLVGGMVERGWWKGGGGEDTLMTNI